MTVSQLPSVCFVACHGGPADHFATFAQELQKKGYPIAICASGPALQKFRDRNLEIHKSFSLNNQADQESINVVHEVTKVCEKASVVMTDVGHIFCKGLQQTLAIEAPQILRLAYYDNPEPYVPGGYSLVAKEVMQVANKVLFANANFEEQPIYVNENQEIDLPLSNRLGIGYYSIGQALEVMKKRQEIAVEMRAQFFEELGIEDNGQRVYVYCGGNNEAYFDKAFPAFLNLLSSASLETDLSNSIFVLQQHPGAKFHNIDGIEIEEWSRFHKDISHAPKLVLSNWNTSDIQVIADKILYYQTSMSPLFALADIPTVQVGHETYSDVLVRNGLCPSVTKVDELLQVMEQATLNSSTVLQRKQLFEGLGIKDNWVENLIEGLSLNQLSELNHIETMQPI